MKRVVISIVFLAISMFYTTESIAQISAVKTNALMLMTGGLNAEVETSVSPNVSINVMVIAYPWKNSYIVGERMLFFAVQPGMRYWFRGMQTGPFIGAHLSAFAADIIPSSKRFSGIAVGLGGSLGYSWMLAPKWNLEVEGGLSLFYYMMNIGGPTTSIEDMDIRNNQGFIPAPTKLGVNIVYLF